MCNLARAQPAFWPASCKHRVRLPGCLARQIERANSFWAVDLVTRKTRGIDAPFGDDDRHRGRRLRRVGVKECTYAEGSIPYRLKWLDCTDFVVHGHYRNDCHVTS